MVRFLGERITYVGRTETERKPFQYRVTLPQVERTQQNPYGLVVSSVEQYEIPLRIVSKVVEPSSRYYGEWYTLSAICNVPNLSLVHEA